jgi:hypothetical protein
MTIQHNNNDFTTSSKQSNVMSISLHIPKQINERNKKDSIITSSVSSSASSVLFTHSFCSSSDPNNNNNNNNNNSTELSFNKIPTDKWQQDTIKEWLESIGMQEIHIKNCFKTIKTGKVINF